MALRLLVILAALFLATPSRALAPGLPEVVLTPERVEAVVSAYPLMRARLAELDDEFEGQGDANTLASSLEGLALAGAVNNALNVAAQDQGFVDFLDWVTATRAVLLAHAFAEHSGMDAEVQQALENIDKQPGMSAAQKEQMKEMIRQSMGVLDAMRPPEENLAAVAPFQDEIEAMLED